MTTRRFLLLSALATLLLMPLAFAFGAAAGQAATDPVTAALKPIHYIITIAVPAAIGLIKLVVPRVPKYWLPIIAPLLGAAIDFLTLGSFGTSTVLGLIAGSAGVGLREIADQLGKRMVNED